MLTRDQLAEPRLASLFELYVHVTEVAEIALHDIAANPHHNTDAFARALWALHGLGNAASAAILALMELKRNAPPAANGTAYDVLVDAIDGRIK